MMKKYTPNIFVSCIFNFMRIYLISIQNIEIAEVFLMKNKYLVFISSILLIFLFTGCKKVKDEVTDTSFKINLEEASKIYSKETTNNDILEIKFDIPENFNAYGYIFKNKEEEIYIDAMNGNVSKLSSGNTLKSQKPFKLEDINSVEPIAPLLSSAKKEVGGLTPRILSWILYFDNEDQRLKYNIDVKTTTSDKEVYRNAIK